LNSSRNKWIIRIAINVINLFHLKDFLNNLLKEKLS